MPLLNLVHITCKVHAIQPSHFTQLKVTKDALIDG